MQKLFDSEIKVMELIWANGPIGARELSLIAYDTIGWNKNTTYTVIKKLVSKGFVKRDDPGFVCTALISREKVCKRETENLIDKFFNGSKSALFSALLDDESLTAEELSSLREMIEKR